MRYGLGIVGLLAVGGMAAAAPQATPFRQRIDAAKAAMMGDPEKALPLARAAIDLAGRMPDPRQRALAIVEAQWLQGEALTRVNRPDRAQPIVAAALASVERGAAGTKLNGDLLISAATIDWTMGRIRAALGRFQAAYTIYDRIDDARGQAKALQYIGTIYFDARDYPRMLRYYRDSYEVYRGDPALSISALNNQGDALKEMKRFPEAIRHYRDALVIARRMDSPVLETRILTNLASAQYQSGHLAAADAVADRGIATARGLDTGWEPFLWGVKAQVALARGDLAACRADIERTFAGADLAATTVQFREFHETGWRLYQKLGDDARALAHLSAFKRLDDEARDVTASTNSALLGARFDFTNQQLRITRLKTGQLQRDVALERQRATMRRVTLYGLVAALVAAIAAVAGTLYAYFSIRRSRDAVRDANETLSTTNTALEKALKAKTEFLATTSHEIRTPLNGILGMTQVLLADRRIDPAVRERVEVVHGAGENMRALVDDILDVAKMETGEVTIVTADMPLRRVIGDAMRLWTGQATAKRLALTLDMADAVPAAIVADEARLRQIVFNLMSNAIKFTERGAVTVAVDVAGQGADEMLRIAVTDTGIGIAPCHHEEIFEPFKQIEGGTDRRFGGTGLGLAISRRLARAMDGRIDLVSLAGQGATFTLVVPLVRAAVATPAASAVRATELAGARVLLVDAHPLAQSMLKAVLAPAARAIDAVADAGEAVTALSRGEVDLLLVDLASVTADGVAPHDAIAPLVAAAGGAACVVMIRPDVDPAALPPVAVIRKPVAAPVLIAALDRACRYKVGPADRVSAG